MDPSIACIKATAYGGRGVFATKSIPKDTLILTATPYASVVYHVFRKEVCAECLAYAFDSNRNTWNVKHEPAGVWFCSTVCCDAWVAQHGTLEETLHKSMERLAKTGKAFIVGKVLAVTKESINEAWRRPLKWSTSLSELELDTARFVVSGIIRRHQYPDSWTDLLQLQDNELAYITAHPEGLASSLRIGAFVFEAVKAVKFDFDVLDMVRQMLARDQGNAFGLYEMEGDTEMFGFAMYTWGSYFNHDCTPNIRKERHGRCMAFYTAREIHSGEELCISYIDIKDTVAQRQEELMKEWYFRCVCGKCNEESTDVIQ
ncbi:hypothetical protein CPB85DRAFT_1432697 [Mucidula mucida]|nr:hypothetical protein CPB85DRAFT_1432697 [Mucidula mucida]